MYTIAYLHGLREVHDEGVASEVRLHNNNDNNNNDNDNNYDDCVYRSIYNMRIR